MADVGNLTAKLTLDTAEFSKGVGKAKDLAGTLAGGIGKVLGTATAAVGAAVGAAAAGVSAIVKESVSSFAEYEQLVGGVETLFKDSADTVQDYANEAFKTAGVSANEYMEVVTSFSAAMIKSLGGDTQAAADLSNQAIIDMSDNANKMGTDLSSIQQAYQGFAKQNYTMLDNLKLGYGGTQAEMERLIRDAEKLDSTFSVNHETVIKNKQAVDEMTYSFADITKAIHIVQENLGIAGTTAKEASETISGSFHQMEAAWQNVLTSIAGGGPELSQTLSQLVESAKTFIANLLPVLSQALTGVAQLINGIVPVIAEELPGLVETVVPLILEAAVSIVSALTTALPDLIQSIMDSLFDILPQIAETVVSLLDAIAGSLIPALLSFGSSLIMELGSAIIANIDQLSQTATNLLMSLITFLTEALPMLVTVAVSIITALAQNIADNAPLIITGIVELMATILTLIAENLPTILEAGLTIINGIVTGILWNLHNITDAVVQIIVTLVTTIIEHLPDILMAAIEIGLKIVAGIVMAIPNLIVSVGRMLGIVQDAQTSVTNSTTQMTSAVSTSAHGISSTLESTYQDTQTVAKNIQNKATDLNVNMKEVERQARQSFGMTADVVDFARDKVEAAFKSWTKIIEEGCASMQDHMWSLASAISGAADSIASSCYRIADAASSALDALNRLAAAQVSSSGGFGGGHAAGGYVRAGTTYLVGELGPELITPTRSGYVHTADETASMLGGQSININISGDVYDDERSMRRKLKDAMLSVLQEQMAYE